MRIFWQGLPNSARNVRILPPMLVRLFKTDFTGYHFDQPKLNTYGEVVSPESGGYCDSNPSFRDPSSSCCLHLLETDGVDEQIEDDQDQTLPEQPGPAIHSHPLGLLRTKLLEDVLASKNISFRDCVDKDDLVQSCLDNNITSEVVALWESQQLGAYFDELV